ncbi:replication-relaxation family protein [Geomicrobium sp. JCM 19037]|uniref:replication-relaxation family protein n=1 Tax=Geomicrobium sp. JCM 19037 TaxID=1460634 RepID=UPI001EE64CCE|nr:replication-relaxation family protein [Geomicrobium sp. JCM 19037]
MAADTQIKPDSTKLPHFLRIADFYIDCAKYEDPALFTVEPRVGAKGSVEPDVFMIWKNAPFYVEIQRTQYSARVFSDKLARYERHYNGGDWRNYEWQPADGALFPHVWIVGATQYDVGGTPFNVLQSRSVGELFALT